MSIYIHTHSTISGIANFAQKMGLGDAAKIGSQLYTANISCFNEKYNKAEINDFVLDDTQFDNQETLENLYQWLKNSANCSQWFEVNSAAAMYNSIRQACFSPVMAGFQEPETKYGFSIGEPVYFDLAHSKHCGYVVGFHENIPCKVYGANGLEDNCGKEIELVLTSQFDKSLYFTSAPIEYVSKDTQLSAMPALQALNAKQIQLNIIDAEKKKQEELREKNRQERAAFEEKLRKVMPKGAMGVIVASKEVYNNEKSCPMSDYHQVDDTNIIILGFSKHSRMLFPEMRKFAKTHPSTAFLADLPKEHENRRGYRYSIDEHKWSHAKGWNVEKIKFYGTDYERNILDVPTGELHIQEPSKKTKAAPANLVKTRKAALDFNSLLFA